MLIALMPLLTALGPAAVLVAMAIVFAETGLLLGFFLPGDGLLFTLGLLAAAGAFHLPVWVVVVGVFVAAVVGDQVGYLLGRRFGPRVFNRAGSRWFRASHVDRARLFFDRHGSKAVILARFVPVVRTFTPVVAGVAEMPRRRFTFFNLAGGLLWTTILVAAGYFLGGIPLVAAHVELIVVGLALLSVVPALVAYLLNRRTRTSPAPYGAGSSIHEGREALTAQVAA
jgi:membrane protein DedA with SNARE-associated domain